MTTRAPSLPTPFPVRAFVAIGAAWVLLDLPAVPVITGMGGFLNTLCFEVLWPAWLGFLAAKVMLMLGWWFLGEGMLRYRLAGLALFAIAAIALTESAFGLAMFAVLLAPLSVWIGMAFVVLRGLDYRLVRNVPAAEEKASQFTLRQLMLLTLVAAIVSGLLRWAQQSDRSPAIFGLIGPLLAWVYPLVMTRGVLRPKWYPEGLFAAGLTVYVVALPSFALPAGSAVHTTLVIASYALMFTAHLLLLRLLGFRLVQLPNAATSKQWLPADWGAR